MNDIVLLGLNHKTAAIELRECMAFSNDDTDNALEMLQKDPDINEVMLFSTCNRVEILLITKNRARAVEAAKRFIAEFKQVPDTIFEECFYIHAGDEAVRHVFRVAASLDSMMVGEPQILGQIKEAYQTAVLKQTPGVILNRLLPRAFSVAKRVRTETGIGDHAVSISYAAIELGRKIFDTLEAKKVLLIGAGEMAEIAVEHLLRHKVGDIFVANRTFERGVALAGKFNGSAINFEEITGYLQQADVIISSTGAPGFVITDSQVKDAMTNRRNRPIFFIDIAVPRDIDPQINRLPNAYVYDIDDLKDVVEDNLAQRNKEAMKGERIVDEAVINFKQWHDSLSVVPTIVALRQKVEAIAKAEVNKTLKTLNHLSDNDYKAINRMTNAIVNKLLHDPTLFLKNNGHQGGMSASLDITRRLFNLDN